MDNLEELESLGAQDTRHKTEKSKSVAQYVVDTTMHQHTCIA